jgi:hypothetical protein
MLSAHDEPRIFASQGGLLSGLPVVLTPIRNHDCLVPFRRRRWPADGLSAGCLRLSEILRIFHRRGQLGLVDSPGKALGIHGAP